jgi:hypothetical protein
MRLFVATLVAALLLPLAALAADAKTFGKGVNGTDRVKIADLLAKPDGYVGKVVRVEGVVSKVCEHRGCWVEIAQDGTAMRVKVEDGAIVFPREIMGKRIAAEGVFAKHVVPARAEAAKGDHPKVDHAKPAHDEATCQEHQAKPAESVVYQIQGTGAVVL